MATMKSLIRVCVMGILCLLAVEAKVKVRLDQQRGMFEGDVPMDKRLRNGILKASRWTNGVIPYDYGISVSQKYIDLVDGALREIEQNTCIRFVKRTNQQNFVRIINSTGCYSQVGMKGGMQYLSLMESGWSSCWYHEVILHEFLHAVGLWHEQSRYDRDSYISIDTRSVDAGTRFNFDVVSQQWSNVYDTPYDFYSVMHYGKTAFSSNSQITIRPKDARYLDVIGNQKRGSANDWAKVKRIYDCSGTSGGITNTKNCADNNAGCAGWAKSGECTRNPAYMQQNCFKSCNPSQCGGGGGSSSCTDSNSSCPGWAKAGECSRNPSWMKANCKKSCGSC